MQIRSRELKSLVIFRPLLAVPPLAELVALLDADRTELDALSARYADFAYAVYAAGGDLADAVLSAVTESENFYTEHLLSGKGDGARLEALLRRELDILARVADFDGWELRTALADPSLPTWGHRPLDLGALYLARMANIAREGFGIYAKYHVFTLREDGELAPVNHPDPQSLETLYGYENERRKVIANTEAFLAGRAANNVLLYGDAGTGKSSTVKAIANAYRAEGLRLIELKKNQLYLIPGLMDKIAKTPLHFILFIDDLTFSSSDRDFCALKAILEGGVNSRGSNILIYATSNHRHMIKETTADRDGDEINVNDRIQEIVSLSARFGLTVTYQRPDKELYSDIVLAMAEEAGITLDTSTLLVRAEAHAIRAGGRNPRTARQFIDMLSGGVG